MRVSTQLTTSANSSNINYESFTKGNNSMVVIIQLEMPLTQNQNRLLPMQFQRVWLEIMEQITM